MFSNLEKYVTIYQYLSCFHKINFNTINLNTELGQQATLLMGGRNNEAHAQSTLDFTKLCDQREPMGQESIFIL